MEKWRQIRDFPRYSVSDQGRIRNDDTDRIMALVQNGSGVVMAFLVREGRQYARGVAKLVATHFLPDGNHLATTPVHRDGDRTNNFVENFVLRPRWYAYKYQQQFERDRRPFVDHSIIETETGQVFANSWEAAVHFGVLETEVAHSYHAYEGRGERVRALPTYYYFRSY